MKKIFLTSAALALACGGGVAAMEGGGGAAFASAEAKFGVTYDEANDGMEAQFFHDLDFSVGASGTTDDGIAFGASVKLDGNDSAGRVKNARAHMTFDGMHTLTIGDGLDAADILAGGLGDPGLDGVNADDHAEALRNKANTDFLYEGTYGFATVGLSLGDVDAAGGDEEWAFGASFDLNPIRAGIGVDSNEVISLGANIAQGAVSAAMYYALDDDTNGSAAGKPEGNSGGVEVGYKMSDNMSFQLVAGQSKIDDVKGSSFGGGFAHDLGGGATLKGGIGSYECTPILGDPCTNGEKYIKADFGVAMTF